MILFPKRKNPKYKLMGKTRFFQKLQGFKNLIDKAQVRRTRSQKYLIKIKSNFQSHEDPVFFLDIAQEIKNDKIYIQNV